MNWMFTGLPSKAVWAAGATADAESDTDTELCKAIDEGSPVETGEDAALLAVPLVVIGGVEEAVEESFSSFAGRTAATGVTASDFWAVGSTVLFACVDESGVRSIVAVEARLSAAVSADDTPVASALVTEVTGTRAALTTDATVTGGAEGTEVSCG